MSVSSAAGKSRPQIPGRGWSAFTNHVNMPPTVLKSAAWVHSAALLASLWLMLASPNTEAQDSNVFLNAVVVASRIFTFSELDEITSGLLPLAAALLWTVLLLLAMCAVFALAFGSSNLDAKFQYVHGTLT